MGKRAVEKTEEEIEAEALAAKKAAKKAKKAAAAAAAAEAEEEEDPEAAVAAKKAAKKAKKAAAAAEAEAQAEEEAAPKKVKKAKKVAVEEEDDEEEAPKKKTKTEEESAPAPEPVEEEWAPKGKGKGKGNKEFEIFIGGLPYGSTEDVLRKDFEECGQVVKFRMPLNEEGACRGIAFCEYTDKESVEKALKFDQTDYGGRYISVRMSGDDSKGKGKGKAKGNKECEVFVGGLPFSTTEETLKKDFADCGEIVNFRMPLNEEGRPRGIAFIEYKDKEACEKALKFNETDYGGRSLSVKMSGDGGGDKGKGKGKKGKKGKAPSEAKAKSSGCIVEGAGEKKTFADSDSE